MAQTKLARKADLLTAAAAAAAAQTTANTAVINAAAAQTTANTGVTNAAAAQATANTGVSNASTAQATANTGVTNAATAQTTANQAVDLANQALNAAKPVSQGTFLISGGSVAFAGTRSFTVAPATYRIGGVQYSSPQTTVTIGAADGSNPRFDAIVASAAVPGVVSVIAGTAAATPSFPDVDPLAYVVLSYVQIDAAVSAVAIATTDIYKENTEWTSSVSGGTINAASTSNPRTSSKDIEATAAVAGDYVRLTAPVAISLAGQRQLVFFIRPKAAFANPKSIAVTFYLSGVKVGQSVSISNGQYGFVDSTLLYQQLVIPITNFSVPSTSLVDRIEYKVVGSGAAIGFYIDDIFLEGASTAVPQPILTAQQAAIDNLRVRTILFPIDGGGAVITAGVKGDVTMDFAGKILSWRILGDQSGSIVIDLWRDTYANYPPTVADTITASAKPTITTATKAESSALTGWNTSFNAGDIFRPNVDSVTTLTRATLSLKVLVA